MATYEFSSDAEAYAFWIAKFDAEGYDGYYDEEDR